MLSLTNRNVKTFKIKIIRFAHPPPLPWKDKNTRRKRRSIDHCQQQSCGDDCIVLPIVAIGAASYFRTDGCPLTRVSKTELHVLCKCTMHNNIRPDFLRRDGLRSSVPYHSVIETTNQCRLQQIALFLIMAGEMRQITDLE